MPFIRTVLFATDHSEGAERALLYAERLAEREDADLHVLHVVQDESLLPLDDFELDPAEVAAELDLPPPPRRAAGEPQRLEVERRAPAAASGILSYAREAGADVIVIGTHGRRGVRRLVLGSVAEEVVRLSDRPVLVVGPESDPKAEIRRVLAPVDFSEHARRALLDARKVAALLEAELDVLHVIEEVTPPDAYDLHAVPLATGEVQARSREALGRLLEETPGPEASVEVRIGYPAAVIADYAADSGAGLIVLASHGRTGLRRFLLGSVAERVLRHAPCPVLVVKSFGRRLGRPARDTEASAL